MVPCLRALLIHKGVKPLGSAPYLGRRLRALLIHKGVKLKIVDIQLVACLRALLIHKGVKQEGFELDKEDMFESFVNS